MSTASDELHIVVPAGGLERLCVSSGSEQYKSDNQQFHESFILT